MAIHQATGNNKTGIKGTSNQNHQPCNTCTQQGQHLYLRLSLANMRSKRERTLSTILQGTIGEKRGLLQECSANLGAVIDRLYLLFVALSASSSRHIGIPTWQLGKSIVECCHNQRASRNHRKQAWDCDIIPKRKRWIWGSGPHQRGDWIGVLEMGGG